MSKVMKAMTDRRMVLLFAFIIYTAFSFLAFDVPIDVSVWVQDFYDEIEKYGPGSKIFLPMSYGPDMIGDCHPNIVLVWKYAMQKEWKVISWAWSAKSHIIAEQVLNTVFGSPYQNDPGYGIDWVYLGMLPGGQPMLQVMCETGIQSYRDVDNFGTPLKDMPVTDGFDILKNDVDIVVSFGGGYSVMPVTKLQYGIPYVQAGIQGDTSMFASDYAVGNIIGMMPGIKGAFEFEKLTGLVGGAGSYISSTVAISIFVMAGIVLSNIYYFAFKPKELLDRIPDRMREEG